MYTQKEQRYHKIEVLSKKFKHPVFNPPKLVDGVLEELDKRNQITEDSEFTVLFNPEFAVSLIEDYGVNPKNITLFTDGDPLLNKIAEKMGINHTETIEDAGMKKFDTVMGNPPYEKSRAIKFLNASADFSDQIMFVMPRTVRKRNAVNRIRPDLHLEYDKSNPGDIFNDKQFITTCTQYWVKDKSKKRPRVKGYGKELVADHFQFVSMEESDIGINKVGALTGRVLVKGEPPKGKSKRYEDKSPLSTYFIKVRDEEVKNNLIALEDKLVGLSTNSVSNPTINRDDLIKAYIEEYMQ